MAATDEKAKTIADVAGPLEKDLESVGISLEASKEYGKGCLCCLKPS